MNLSSWQGPDLAIGEFVVLSLLALVGLLLQLQQLRTLLGGNGSAGLLPSVISFVVTVASIFGLGLLGYGYLTITAVAFTVGFAAAVVLLLASLVARYAGSAVGVVGIVGVSVTVLATFITAIQVGAPDANPLNTRGSCVNTPVLGAHLVVRTLDQGQNARSGPGTTYPIANRFDANCLVGVDGYCIGQPRLDHLAGFVDYRWFRVRFRTQFVPAAAMFEVQGVDADLGATADPDCPGGLPAPALAGTPTVNKSGQLHVGLTHGELLGVATLHPGDDHEVVVEQVGDKVRNLGSDGSTDVRLGLHTADKSGADGLTLVAVAPCLAVNVPAYTGARFLVWQAGFDPAQAPQVLDWKTVSTSADAALRGGGARALATACLLNA